MEMVSGDKTLVCRDCGKEFVFAAGEQEFYERLGFGSQPVRCKPCRLARKVVRARREDPERMCGLARPKRYEIVCDRCGGKAWVPFRPSGEKPVYCRACFEEMR